MPYGSQFIKKDPTPPPQNDFLGTLKADIQDVVGDLEKGEEVHLDRLDSKKGSKKSSKKATPKPSK